MTMPILNYKCPNCGASLTYNHQTDQWDCGFCLSSFSYSPQPTEEEEPFASASKPAEPILEQEPALEEQQAEIQPPPVPTEPPDPRYAERMKTLFGEASSFPNVSVEMEKILCPHCGAQTLQVKQDSSPICPLCSKEAQTTQTENFSAAAVLPFLKTREDAEKKLRERCKHSPLLPWGFFSRHRQRLIPCYLPYWLHSCEISVKSHYRTTAVTEKNENGRKFYTSGNYNIEDEKRALFENIGQAACSQADSNMLKAIEPFSNAQAEPFSAEKLSGRIILYRDISAEDSLESIREPLEEEAREKVRRFLLQKQPYSQEQPRCSVLKSASKPVLYPVWLLQGTDHGKPFLYAMNALNGKCFSRMPFNILKALTVTLGAFAAFAAVFLIGGILF